MTSLYGSIPSPRRWVHLWTFKVALVTVGFGYPLHSLILV
ncbi:hypothetical protein CK203_040398 [Vitis vinifera]|uniref:Uncharacterized protein n=1 Tax=Vitis vinifera TaxID=29760 RepID=A0A438FX03_VITVI|nr:hypothetical protein CK203_040398 [Vitis vinifera]